jgi:hypothetical protein
MGNHSTATGYFGRHLPFAGVTAALFLAAQAAPAADDAAADAYNAALTDHVPAFITAPGQTDYLFVVVVVILLLFVLAIGNFYFQLHAVPERIAHHANKGQLEIVSVLALISLFTHNNIYWILGLLLALVRIPDFLTPLHSIARSLVRLANRVEGKNGNGAPPAPETAEPVGTGPAPAPRSGAQGEGI